MGGDILTVQSLGAYPVSVITAVTSQDTRGVYGLYPIDSNVVFEQWKVLTQDIYPHAVKWGMIGNSAILDVLVRAVSELGDDVPVVVDPVLASGRGDTLSDQETRQFYHCLGLPQKTVVLTPNFKEFYQIMGACTEVAVEHLVEAFFDQISAPSWLLLKGVHAPTEQVVHTLWNRRKGRCLSLECPRLPNEYHGSGCTFASALAVFLAEGNAVEQAFKLAQDYTWNTLNMAYFPGAGQAIPNRQP